MNYQNLDKEIKEYTSYYKYCDSINAKFLAFFRTFSQSGSKFIGKTKKSIEEFCNEINKEEYFPSTLNKNIINLFDEYKNILDKFQNVFTNIEKDIINKLIEFDKNFKTNCKNSLNNLTNLNIYLSDDKTKLDKTKNNYFESCKQIQEFNKKYLSGKNKENTKEDELIKLNEQFEKMKQTSETKKVYYRIEVTKLNDLLLSNENYYSDILNGIEKNEEERSQFYANMLLLFNNSIKHFNFETNDSLKKNEKFIDDIFTKRDIKMFTLYFNKTNNNKDKTRFLYEEFFDFENNLNNIEIKETEKQEKIKEEKGKKNKKENDVSEIIKIDFNLALKINEMGKEPLIDNESMDNNEFIELDNIIFNLINRDEKIADEKFVRIISTVEEKYDGSKNFLYLLMGFYVDKNIVKFKSIENFFLLNSVLNIVINYIWDNDEYAYLALFILFIGEKTVFCGPNDKYPANYLCKVMSKNTIYHTFDFWSKLINLKIKMLAKIKMNEEFKRRRKNSIKKESGIFYKLLGVSGNNNYEIENEILLSQIYKEKSAIYLSEVLEEYIRHFYNYNFIEQKTSNLIEQLAEEYYLNIKQKNYFIKMIDSNIIYLKSINPYFSEFKQDLIKYNNQEALDKLYFEYNSNKKFKNIKNNKIKILLFSMKYLSNKDIINILPLDKEFYSIIKKYLYKNILMKYHDKIDIKKHISIWKIILDYKSIKSKYDYNTLKQSLMKGKIKDSVFDTIDLDITRTSFRINQESNQNKLGNILKVASKQLPSVNYCQGMNHIAAFLLVLCDENEEEAFYLFLSILLYTDYCSLIDNDLIKLNSFFYCFERLLHIIFPEMYNYLMSTNVNSGYYLSPWFITLFTLGLYEEKDENNLDIIMALFDMFLFSGWKAMFKIGISLIRNNTNEIFSLPYEQLVHYLNNDIMHSDFLKKSNKGEFINIFVNFKISNKLIDNICKEFEMKQNILNKNIN